MDPRKQPGIRIAQILLEEASFGHREDFLALSPSTPAEVGDVQGQLQSGVFHGGTTGFVRIEVKTNPENRPVYNFHLTMLALVSQDEENANLSVEKYVPIAGPTLLYPFLREAVANLTARGRFGPVWLKPFNIKAAIEEPDEQAESKPSTTRRSSHKSARKRAREKRRGR